MNLDAFISSARGELVPISGTDAASGDYAYWGFAPSPLPAHMELAGTTWAAITAATAELSRLDQAARQIPNPALLRRPTLRREAQSTSALEGTIVAFTDLLEAEASDDDSRMTPELLEVLNYVRAAEDAFDWISERPVTIGLLEGLQRTLTAGTGAPGTGQIRDRQVVIGTPGRPIREARFVPQPPGDALRSSVEALIDWMREPSDLPAVARAALAHYQFETIHPFTDGNGRIGRLMIALQLLREGALRDPVLIVSPWFEARRRQYHDHLLDLAQTGDFNPWITFFSNGIEAQSRNTRERIEQLLEIQAQYRSAVAAANLRGVATQIAEGLIEHPIMSVNSMAARYEVAFPTSNTAIDRLRTLGILREITGRSRGRWFEASGVMRILDA